MAIPVNNKRFLTHWLPVLVYGLLIFIQSSLPSSDKVPQFPYGDKLLHVGGYALLSFLLYRALGTQKKINKASTLFILSSVLSAIYGISDEIHQHFVPSREADILDVLADMVGSIVGAICGRFFLPLRMH